MRKILDPHIVFNNLNNLYALSISNSDMLAINLGRLRSVLEYYFVQGKATSIQLEKEVNVVEDYIGLEKLRYGKRLKVEFSKKGELGKKYILPLLFFTIVENCFEHGCSDESGDM